MDNYITAASFILTEGCNLNCTYCFEKDKDLKKTMTTETAKQGVDFLVSQALLSETKTIDIMFFGGEPTLKVDLMKYIFDYAVEVSKINNLNQPKFSMITNGFKFDKELENFILHWHNTGIKTSIQISLDGCAEVQDANRLTHAGTKSSKMVADNVIKYVELFKTNSIPLDSLTAHGVLTKESLPYMFKSYEYYKELGFKRSWFLTLPEENWELSDETILKEQMSLIKNDIINLVKTTGDISYYHNMTSLSDCQSKHPEYPCLAGKNFVSIDTDGAIYPCHRFKFNDHNSVIGNIYDGVTDDDRDIFIEYDHTHLIGDIKCSQCNATSCYRCIAAFKEISGNMLIGSPKYCNMSRVEHEIRETLKAELTDLGYLNIKSNKDETTIETLNAISDFNKTLQSIEFNLQYFTKEQDVIKQKVAMIDKKMDITLTLLTSLLKE